MNVISGMLGYPDEICTGGLVLERECEFMHTNVVVSLNGVGRSQLDIGDGIGAGNLQQRVAGKGRAAFALLESNRQTRVVRGSDTESDRVAHADGLA